jgi:6-phosphogluconolactonase
LIDALGPRGGRSVVDRDGQRDGEPAVVIVADADAVGATAARHVVEAVAAVLAERARADIALTGGSTPEATYRHLVAPSLRDRVDWSRVHLWWGDDRYVPRADPLSNVRLADERLRAPAGLPIPAVNVHPFPVDRALGDGLGAGWCAATYAAEVVATLPSVDGWPSFDLILVGIGADGHLLSVFPGSSALASDRIGLAIPAPSHIEPHVERVTLNPAVVGSAKAVLATAAGAPKAEVVARILEGPRDPAALPGVLARCSTATWILDLESAAGLTGV